MFEIIFLGKSFVTVEYIGFSRISGFTDLKQWAVSKFANGQDCV